jgi:hypothetical protein
MLTRALAVLDSAVVTVALGVALTGLLAALLRLAA